MKKEYKSPSSVVLNITTDSIITASGGDTIQENVYDGTTIEGNNAWSRRRHGSYSIWEEEEEDEDEE
jgi:hypothetical protein